MSLPYKTLMTFGGSKQDFMLVVGQSLGTNTGKDKPTGKHLFAMESSKVSASCTHADAVSASSQLSDSSSVDQYECCRTREMSSMQTNTTVDSVSSTDQGNHPPHLQLHQQCSSAEGRCPPPLCPGPHGCPARQPEEQRAQEQIPTSTGTSHEGPHASVTPCLCPNWIVI